MFGFFFVEYFEYVFCYEKVVEYVDGCECDCECVEEFVGCVDGECGCEYCVDDYDC